MNKAKQRFGRWLEVFIQSSLWLSEKIYKEAHKALDDIYGRDR